MPAASRAPSAERAKLPLAAPPPPHHRLLLPLSSVAQGGQRLSVVAIFVATVVLCEAISWLLIYRTAIYNSLRASIERHSRKLDAMKAGSGPSSSSGGAGASSSSAQPALSRAKKMDRVETSLKDAARELSLAKLKSGAIVAAVLFVIFGLLNSLFEGRVASHPSPSSSA